MNTPVAVIASSSQMTVSWASITAPADTGASSITYYSLEWNQGSLVNSWIELTTYLTLVDSFTMTSGFTPGITYQFRVKAMNSYGYGPYSSVASLTPMSVPS